MMFLFGKSDAEQLFENYGFNQTLKNDETIKKTAKAFNTSEYTVANGPKGRNRLNSGILRNQFILLLDPLNGKPLNDYSFTGVSLLHDDQYVLVRQNSESETWEVYQGNTPNSPRKIYSSITLQSFFDEMQEKEASSAGVSKPDVTISGDAQKGISHFVPTQIIYYGVPGCGKSNKIKELLQNVPERNKIRVVFHPEYTNADFVGQILPKVDGRVTYEFSAGPFAQIVKKAYLNPDENFYLVIEEINRGNAAAIFGDMFQLLDRLKAGETDSLGNDPSNEYVNTFKEGWSHYFVQNDDVNDYIRKVTQTIEGKYVDSKTGSLAEIKVKDIRFNSNTAVRLPPNLSIWATMNTSDQNVFTLDNAFQRRFDMELIRNEFDMAQPAVNIQYNAEIGGTSIAWGRFWNWINGKIVTTLKGLASTEDKRLGVWFVSNVNGKISNKVFAEKVLKYLWDDVFKFKRKDVFLDEIDTLEQLIDSFESASGPNCFKVFKNSDGLISAGV